MSSMIMRHETTPEDHYVEAFCNYKPVSTDSKVTHLWDRLVKEPCQRALHEYYPVLEEHHRLEEVFHYQDLGALVKSLKKAPEGKYA
jgi:hypothetical protein